MDRIRVYANEVTHVGPRVKGEAGHSRETKLELEGWNFQT